MFRVVLGALATGLLIIVGGFAVVETGAFDVRASTPHGPILAWAAHTTMIHAAQRGGSTVPAPPALTARDVAAGFALYDRDCVACHGGPGVSRADWVAGMNPSPPFLLDATRHWTPQELYWIVGNGVKMTGMPAWRLTRSDAQVWDVVGFLRVLPYMTPATYAKLRRAQAARTSFPPTDCCRATRSEKVQAQ